MRIASNLYDLLSTLCTLRSESLSAGHGGFLTESAPMHCIPILVRGGALRDPGNFRQIYLFRFAKVLENIVTICSWIIIWSNISHHVRGHTCVVNQQNWILLFG